MSKEFAVCFYQNGEVELFKGNGGNREKVIFKNGELKKVNQKEMFKWIEVAHNENVKLSIYEITMVCDIS